LLSSHSRLHGSSTYRVPWLFDEEAVDVLRFFTRLKCRLMPTIFQAACQAHQTGLPVMRAMLLEFPQDPGCDYLDRQYMLGDSLLVAPVFTPDGSVDYYLPAGRWTRFLSGEVLEGGRWRRETHDYLSLPLLVRPNSLLAVGADDQRPDYDYARGVTFHAFELEEGADLRAQVPALDGSPSLTVRLRKADGEIRVQAEGQAQDWRLLLRGVTAVTAVEGGSVQSEPGGVLIVADPGAESLHITL
ncbi:MAG: alpha-xylosidase, partial [Chloroflexi bacterium]|nr:alpha-xylosidase [Chloroflexota bacterium]